MTPPAGVILFVNINLGYEMSEFVNNIRIEEGIRNCISEPVLEILTSGEEILVSGMPIMIVPAKTELPIEHFDTCQPIYDEPVRVLRIFNQRIPIIGHRHIPERYIADEYPAVQCLTFTEDEIIFGIRKELQFSARQPGAFI